MEIVYRKVVVNGPSDLPEDGTYFVYMDGIKFIHSFIGQRPDKRYYDNLTFEDFWLKNIDSYLQPKELPSDEEIEKDFISFANYFHHWKEKIRRGVCPKRPDEIYKEWLRYKLINELK